jgi:predicted membrane protein
MSKKNLKNIFWGLIWIACAGLLIASATNNLVGVGFWSWVFTICFAASTITCLVKLDVTGTVFSAAFLIYIWADPLHIHLDFITLMIAAALISTGLSMLLKPFLKKHKHHGVIVINDKVINLGGKDEHKFTESSTVDTDADVNVNVRMGSATRYIQSSDFRHADIHVSIGDCKVYFDQATITADHAVIELNGSVGDVELYLPRTWQVQNHLDNFIGDMNTHGTPSEDGPLVVLTGTFKVGDVHIYYI